MSRKISPIKIRCSWSRNPTTKIKDTKKLYGREKNKRLIEELLKEDNGL
jgi:hypothetical protein